MLSRRSTARIAGFVSDRVGFQPSDLAKLAFILALARYLMYRDNYRRLRGLVAPLVLTLLPVLLILKEPDLGTSLVLLPVFFVMLFAAGAKRSDLACVALMGLLVLPLLWTEMSVEQKSRITALFDQPAARPPAQRRRLSVAPGQADAGAWAASGGAWWRVSPPRIGPRTTCPRPAAISSSACWASGWACRAWR